jgi:hypothetical protein
MSDKMKKSFWIDPEQTIWEFEATMQGCKAPRDNRKSLPGLSDEHCDLPTHYVGKRKGGQIIQLCSEHFEAIEPTCRTISIEIT